MGNRRRLAENDRKYIEKTYKIKSVHEIAEMLDVNVSTVRRELQRCEAGKYSAREAQIDATKKRYSSARKAPAPIKSYWVKLLIKKQIETCIRMQPTVDSNTIAQITGIEFEKVNYFFNDVKKEILTQ